MVLKNLIPMLNVRDIKASLAFYKKALDFEVVSHPGAVEEWRWATIRSGSVELMLSETESPPSIERSLDPHVSTQWPAIFYFYPDDVEALYGKVCDRGYQPTELITTIYQMKEFSIQDPDGHMLSFGQELQ